MNLPQLMIRVASEFSETPGPRSRDEGDYSGQQFLEEILRPRFEEARNTKQKLIIDLDGTDGYATSFLESAFGGLARIYEPREIIETIALKSNEEPYLVMEIKQYIKEARKT
jgi:hypothetical protein